MNVEKRKGRQQRLIALFEMLLRLIQLMNTDVTGALNSQGMEFSIKRGWKLQEKKGKLQNSHSRKLVSNRICKEINNWNLQETEFPWKEICNQRN